ncbi:MAG: SpaA isopeptide-forming pilin-related protein [Gemmatimonadota bacterium]
MTSSRSGARRGFAALVSAALLASCADDKSPTGNSSAVDVQPAFAVSVSSSNFQQCANGANGGEPCTYINGVLNDSKSLYHESDVIAQRFVIPGLVPGHTYRLAFDYGWEKAVNPGHMNYDFVAGWNATLGALANPCGDPLGNGGADIRGVCNPDNTIRATHSGAGAGMQVIPDAVFTANAPLGLQTELQAALDRFQSVRGADAVRFDILGGSFPGGAFDNVAYTVGGDDVTARFTVRFTASQSTVMLLWGGHFADSRDYRLAVWDDDKNAATAQVTGNLTGAAGQSGAPFHFSQQYIKNTTNGDSTGIGSLSNNVQGSVLEPVPKASIAIAASATNGIGESHTFTVTLSKDLDNGAGPVAAAGEHVSVTMTPASGAVLQLDATASTCDNAGANTDASGQCTMVFTSSAAGTITASASATLLLNGTSVTVTTDGSGDNSGTVVKTFVAGSVRWLKHNGSGALLGGAVFTVCRTQTWNSDLNAGAGGYVDNSPDVCFDVSDNVSGTDNTAAAPADRDGTGGEFELGGLTLGKYTVTEKTAPPGYLLDTDVENVTLSISSPSATITTAFVNVNPDAFITISSTATNNTTEPHTFTAKMTAVPNGGSPVSIADFTITVSPVPSTPGTTTCDAFDAATNSKTCRRTINSNVAGSFTANASATAIIGGVSITRATNATAGTGGSGPAVKTYVAPSLAITKTPDLVTDAGGSVQVGGTAAFTITVSNSNVAGTGSALDVVMTDTLPAGLTWTDNRTECAIDQITVSSVSRSRITCTIGTLVKGASFAVTVTSGTIPSNFIQLPPSPAGTAIEIDGNLTDGAAPGNDWGGLPNTIFNCASTPKIGCDIDLPTGKGDNSFGQGSKEDSPVPTVVSGSIPNNKSDLLRMYVATERFGTTDYLYLAWSRVQEPNGTTNMDFELNQSRTLSANGVTPVRTHGDILVRYDLAQGGTVPELGFHKWITSGSSSLCEASNSVPCWDKRRELTTDVFAAINDVSVPEPIAGGSLSARTFGEASINLPASGIFDSGACTVFGLAYLKSRSSDAFGSELKDFIAPIPVEITNCKPVTLNNTAWASASNFAPTGGNLGDPISDTGSIEVTESGNASINPTPKPMQGLWAVLTRRYRWAA